MPGIPNSPFLPAAPAGPHELVELPTNIQLAAATQRIEACRREAENACQRWQTTNTRDPRRLPQPFLDSISAAGSRHPDCPPVISTSSARRATQTPIRARDARFIVRPISTPRSCVEQSWTVSSPDTRPRFCLRPPGHNRVFHREENNGAFETDPRAGATRCLKKPPYPHWYDASPVKGIQSKTF